MKAFQPETVSTQLSEQEFARLAKENPEELFRMYNQSLSRSLPIPCTSRQSVTEEQDFSSTKVPGASPQGENRPKFMQKYYNQQAKEIQ